MTARTPTQRAKDATARRQAAGGRVVRVILSPAATAALARLTAASGVTITAAVELALLDASPEPVPSIEHAPDQWLTAARGMLK